MRKTYVDKHIFLSCLVQNKLSLTIGKFPDEHISIYMYIYNFKGHDLFHVSFIEIKFINGDQFGYIEI